MNEMLGSTQGYYEGLAKRATELGAALHTTDQQMLDFVRKATDDGKKMLEQDWAAPTAEEVKTLNSELENLFTSTGTNTGVFAIFDVAIKGVDKSLDHLRGTVAAVGRLNPFAQGLTDLATSLGGATGKALADQILGPSLDTWDAGPKLLNTQLSSEMKLLQQIREPQRAYLQGVLDLDDLLKKHKITLDEYAKEIDKLKDAWGKANEVIDLINSATRRPTELHPATPQSNEYAVKLARDKLEFDQKDNEALARSRELEAGVAAEAEKSARAFEHAKLTSEWMSGAPNSKYNTYLQQQLERGDVNAGASLALHNFSDEATNTALVINKAFTTALDDMDKALIEFVDTGKLNLSGLAKDLEHLFISSAFKQTVGGLGSLLGEGKTTTAKGAIIDQSAMTTAGQSAGAEISAEMVTGGAEAGTTIAGEMEVAGSTVAAEIAGAIAMANIPTPGGGGGGGGFTFFSGGGAADDGVEEAGSGGAAAAAAARAAPVEIHVSLGDQHFAAALGTPSSQSAIHRVTLETTGVALATRERLRSRG
jgi:hypothetical protein